VSAIAVHGLVPQPYVGICLQPMWIDPETARELGLPNDTRAVPVVSRVESECLERFIVPVSPASRAVPWTTP
jgi:hypothetical protein